MRSVYQIWRQEGDEKPRSLNEAYENEADAQKAVNYHHENTIYVDPTYDKYSYRELQLMNSHHSDEE